MCAQICLVERCEVFTPVADRGGTYMTEDRLPDLLTWAEWRELNPGVSKLRYDRLVKMRNKALAEAERKTRQERDHGVSGLLPKSKRLKSAKPRK